MPLQTFSRTVDRLLAGSPSGDAQPEALPPDVRDLLNRVLVVYAAGGNKPELRRTLDQVYTRFAVIETNMLLAPHSSALAVWVCAADALLMPKVEAMSCQRVRLRRVQKHHADAAVAAAAAATAQLQQELAAGGGKAGGSDAAAAPPCPAAADAAAGGIGDGLVQLEAEVTFEWRPLAPLHDMLVQWTSVQLLPLLRTEHTLTLTVNKLGRVVHHKDIVRGGPSLPPVIKFLLGLPTPVLSTLLHV